MIINVIIIIINNKYNNNDNNGSGITFTPFPIVYFLIACDCTKDGVDDNNICDSANGVCNCLSGVNGDSCSQCKVGGHHCSTSIYELTDTSL